MQTVTADNGVVIVRSPLLYDAGVPHGFSTRIGGVSPAPFESLNFSCHPVGPLPDGSRSTIHDDPSRMEQNYRLLAQAVGWSGHVYAWGVQVHADGLHWADRGNACDRPNADAVLSDDPGVIATVRVADCVPVLLASRSGRHVAAVHAGWRGVTCGIVVKAAEAMHKRWGIEADGLIAAVGPCIGPEAFEVGPEVAQAFIEAGLKEAVVTRPEWPRPHIDLPGAVAQQLQTAGLEAGSIDLARLCTVGRPDLFFSHRRDKGLTGRMVGVIAPRA